jgi:hypothetical protein
VVSVADFQTGEAPLCDGGAAQQLPQLDVSAHRPDEPHRVGQLPAPRDIYRPWRGRRPRCTARSTGGDARVAASA